MAPDPICSPAAIRLYFIQPICVQQICVHTSPSEHRLFRSTIIHPIGIRFRVPKRYRATLRQPGKFPVSASVIATQALSITSRKPRQLYGVTLPTPMFCTQFLPQVLAIRSPSRKRRIETTSIACSTDHAKQRKPEVFPIIKRCYHH